MYILYIYYILYSLIQATEFSDASIHECFTRHRLTLSHNQQKVLRLSLDQSG